MTIPISRNRSTQPNSINNIRIYNRVYNIDNGLKKSEIRLSKIDNLAKSGD